MKFFNAIYNILFGNKNSFAKNKKAAKHTYIIKSDKGDRFYIKEEKQTIKPEGEINIIFEKETCFNKNKIRKMRDYLRFSEYGC
mgnify:FL=1